MTPSELRDLRLRIDEVKRERLARETAGTDGRCAHPKCRAAFTPSKHTPWQRYCSTRCRNLDWFRLHPEVQREYTRARRARQRGATA